MQKINVMVSEAEPTIKYRGDKGSLEYIRNRYNELLHKKEGLVNIIQHGHYTNNDFALLLKVNEEMLRLDDARTAMVNPHGLYVDTDRIKEVKNRKPLEDNWQLLLENKIPGERRGRDKKYRQLKQIASAGRFKQKSLITI